MTHFQLVTSLLVASSLLLLSPVGQVRCYQDRELNVVVVGRKQLEEVGGEHVREGGEEVREGEEDRQGRGGAGLYHFDYFGVADQLVGAVGVPGEAADKRGHGRRDFEGLKVRHKEAEGRRRKVKEREERRVIGVICVRSQLRQVLEEQREVVRCGDGRGEGLEGGKSKGTGRNLLERIQWADIAKVFFFIEVRDRETQQDLLVRVRVRTPGVVYRRN